MGGTDGARFRHTRSLAQLAEDGGNPSGLPASSASAAAAGVASGGEIAERVAGVAGEHPVGQVVGGAGREDVLGGARDHPPRTVHSHDAADPRRQRA